MNFWKYVNEQGPIVRAELGPCHLWTASSSEGRYGQFWYKGKNWKSHVLAWVLVNGPVPCGMKVCHRCDNGMCVRLSHLFLGTQKQNIADAVQKGRHIKGETSGHHKLTEANVIAIRHNNWAQWNSDEVAAQYGVARATINHVRYGRTWKHLL
jgi:hypothetical protein